MKLDDFLFIIQPNHDYSIKAAMSKTGLSEGTCRRYLNEAVTSGLYTKELITGNGRSASPANRFIKKYHYTKKVK